MAIGTRTGTFTWPAAKLRGRGFAAALPVVIVAAFALVVRFPFFSWALTDDEGSYAYTAHWWFRGLTLYSHDLWFDRPQGIFLAYKAGMLLLGESTWAIRLSGALWAAATVVVVYLLARRLADRRAAFIAAVLCAIYSGAPHVKGFTANAEVFMLLPATLSAYFLLARKPALAGFCASLAILLKPSGAAAIVMAVLWLGYTRANWREWLIFIGAALPLPLLSILHAALTVGFRTYYDAIVGYRLSVNLQTGFRTDEQTAVAGFYNTWPVWFPLTLLAICGLRFLPRKALTFTLCWLIASFFGVAMGGSWFMHYFIQLVQPLAVLGGVGIIGLWTHRSRVARVSIAGLITIVLLLFFAIELPYYLAPPREGMWNLYHRQAYQVGGEVAAYVRAHSSPDSTLYVAFYEPEAYYLAERLSTTIYLFHLDLIYLPGAYESVVASIEERKPDLVLDFQQPLWGGLDSGRFYRALAQGYEVEKGFDGATLYRRR